MALFRRNRPTDPASHPIFAFWAWWNSDGHLLDPSRNSPAIKQLDRHVRAIDDNLAWHFSAGSTAQHRLTVTSEGNAQLRPLAARWLRAAPPADATWEFGSSKAADPNVMTAVLDIDGAQLQLAETVFGVQLDRRRLRADVTVFHPAFSAMSHDSRLRVTFLVLDWLLGEEDVERWIRNIEPLIARPEQAVDADGVRDAVESLRQHSDPDAWVLLSGKDQADNPRLAAFRPALRGVDHPTFDLDNEISVRYPAGEGGLPADQAALDELSSSEADLERQFDARGVLVAHETGLGQRAFHFYTDSEDANTTDALVRWADARGATITSTPDPAWHRVRHITG